MTFVDQPVWVRVCRLSNDGRSNIFPHTSHVHDLRFRRLLLLIPSSCNRLQLEEVEKKNNRPFVFLSTYIDIDFNRFFRL